MEDDDPNVLCLLCSVYRELNKAHRAGVCFSTGGVGQLLHDDGYVDISVEAGVDDVDTSKNETE